MRLLISFIINAVALYVVTLVDHGVYYDTITALCIAAVVFGIVNAIVRPILMLLSLPFIIVTLGLFIFILNGLIFWLTGAFLSDVGFHVHGFWAGFWGAIIMGIVSWILNAFGLNAKNADAAAGTR